MKRDNMKEIKLDRKNLVIIILSLLLAVSLFYIIYFIIYKQIYMPNLLNAYQNGFNECVRQVQANQGV